MHAMHALSQLSYGPKGTHYLPRPNPHVSRFLTPVAQTATTVPPLASIFNLFIIFWRPNLESPSNLAACV
jgi:hypothetical protein